MVARFLADFVPETNFYRVAEPKRDNMLFKIFQPIVRLHGRVICHMNGNFVGFQNMSDIKMSDH